MSSAIGVFFRRDFFEAYGFYREASTRASTINGLNIAGYLPGVGMATAISRWKFAYDHWEDGRYFEYNIGHIVRGILEFIGLGIVVGLLLDTTISLIRYPPSCSRAAQHNEGVECDDF